MVGDDVISKQAFIDFAANATRGIAMRNAEMPSTEVSQVLELSGS
jgi:ATP-binding protein involved in chromosome partitioning